MTIARVPEALSEYSDRGLRRSHGLRGFHQHARSAMAEWGTGVAQERRLSHCLAFLS